MIKSFSFGDETFTVIGAGHFLVESWTHPDQHHAVDTQDMTCSCRGFQCRKRCRHLKAAKKLMKIWEAYHAEKNTPSGQAD